MKLMPLLRTCLALVACSLLSAAASAQVYDWTHWSAEQSVQNAQATRSGETLHLHRTAADGPIHLSFRNAAVLGVSRERAQWWVLPLSSGTSEINANDGLWILPADANSTANSWHLQLHGRRAHVRQIGDETGVDIDANDVTVTAAEARPHSDAFEHRFSITVDGKRDFENTLAQFYWGTMLPLVVERTMAANFPHSDGYVLSTLMLSKYSGTYPAVDHEFQIAGRLAMGSPLDLDIVRRMIELQFRLMNEDPLHLYRAPCALQPSGTVEYHVRRDSKDARENAAMFPLTGNIEVIGEAWQLYAMTKNTAWLRDHIVDLEHAASWTQSHIDPYGRVWSDVYYEDQVIKDGRETEAQAFAAHSFNTLAKMERLLGRPSKAREYAALETKLAAALVRPLPDGFWDTTHDRFTDWVDRNGKAHDHIHLAANTTPVSFGYATAAQTAAVQRTIAENDAEFERFPTFVAAHIQDYSQSEMGVAGPYDLSAAGRYWFWDATYRAYIHDNATLLKQLNLICAEAAKDSYYMGERYDMDHVYYVDGKHSHGAVRYFEYPNVFTQVLIARVLGINKTADADIALTPHLDTFSSADFTAPEYALHFAYDADGFTVRNLSNKSRKFHVDLRSLGRGQQHFALAGNAGTSSGRSQWSMTLAPGAQAHWSSLEF